MTERILHPQAEGWKGLMAVSRPDGNGSTREMENRLFAAPDFAEFLKENRDGMRTPRLCYHLSELCRARGLRPVEVVRRAGLERTYGHQLFSGIRKPSRDKLLQLAFGFGLSVEETQELLKVAQKSPLYPRIMRDAAVMRCLFEGRAIDDLQDLLAQLGLTPIGGEERNG